MKGPVLGGTPPRGAAMIRRNAWSAGALLSFVVAGCAGSLDPGVTGNGGSGGSGGSNGGCEVALLASQCAPCHGAASPASGLDLQSSGFASRLVGQMSQSTALGGACPNKTLLDQGSNPATGFFIDKITNDTPSCGVVMPFLAKMSAANITCLTDWATRLTTGAQQ